MGDCSECNSSGLLHLGRVLGLLATIVSRPSVMRLINIPFSNLQVCSNSAAPSNFNWAVACFFAILVECLIHYVTRARKVYTGPVALVEGRGRMH